MTTESLDGKVALVTGAAGVLGTAIVRALVDRGMRVAMADIQTDPMAGLAAELGDRVFTLALDVGDAKAVQAAGRILNREVGPIDVLVNNAGILSNNKAVETMPAEWHRIMRVNLDGAFYLSRACLPDMRKKGWGRIINICSLAAKTGGITAGTAYTTSKGGLTSLTFSLALESAGAGITVNGISPAYVKTPMVTEQLTPAQRRKLLQQIPVGRFCDAAEVAHVVSFLAAPLSGFITGEIIDINGGLHLD